MTPATELLLKYMNSHPEEFEVPPYGKSNSALQYVVSMLLGDNDPAKAPLVPKEEVEAIESKLREIQLAYIHKRLIEYITNKDPAKENEESMAEKEHSRVFYDISRAKAKLLTLNNTADLNNSVKSNASE